MPSAHTPARPRSKRRLIASIAGGVVVLDAVTKAIAARTLAGKGVVNVFGGAFHLELYRNFAGPGNILSGHPLLVSLLSLAVVVLLAGYAWRVRSTGYAVAIAFLLGGGLGNLSDRLLRAPGPLRGGVVDWIKPTLSGGSLNIADLAINVGVAVMLVALVVDSFRRPPSSLTHRRPSPAEDPGELGPGPDPELAEGVTEVQLHRLAGDEQGLGDLAIAHPRSRVLGDPALGRGE